MAHYLQLSLTGLGAGAVVAVLAIGLVLTFRASNVVNLAHAAMGTYIAYVYYGLRNFNVASTQKGGNLVLPVFGVPGVVHLIDRPTVVTALAIALVVAALVGALVYLLVFRALRNAPPLARLVASLGLFLYLQAVMELRAHDIGAGAATLPLTSLLPNGVVRLGSVVVPTASFVLAGLAVTVAVVLGAVFRYTRFGLSTRAAAESEKGAILIGVSPDRVGLLNWIIASVLAGGAMIFVAGITSQLNPTQSSLLVVPALAAALLARLDSFAMATFAGLAIGVTQSGVATFQSQAAWLPSWLPNDGLRQALPVLLILVAITIRGAHLPTRASLVDSRLPVAPVPRRPWLWIPLLSGAAIVALYTLDAQWRLAIVVSVIAALIALSCVVVTGYVGQISLALYAFAGLAAFATAKLELAGVGFPWAPLVAVILTVVVGILFGLPAVRVRGMTLAVATIAAAVAIEQLVFNSPALNGLSGVPNPQLFGSNLGFLAPGAANFRPAFGVVAVVVLAASMLAVANLRRSPTGLRWLAVRSNERAAAAAGINVGSTKLSAFAASSLFAGLGGALLAYELPALSPQQFLVVGALAVLALTYLGGIATLSGALIAGFLASGGVLTRIQGGAAADTTTQYALSGILLILVATFYPDGLSMAVRRAITRLHSVWLRGVRSRGAT